jgi:hypothetical protein
MDRSVSSPVRFLLKVAGRQWEAKLNEYPQYTTTIDGQDILVGYWTYLRRSILTMPRDGEDRIAT